jgi:hypothetical protein
MAIFGVELTMTGDPMKVSDYVPASIDQLDIQASPDNNDNVVLCDSTGAVFGTLVPGKAWGAKGSAITLGEDLYVQGTNGELANIIWVF